MNNTKYSVLFMRDDTDVKRYRVSPFWLRMFFYIQILLLLCAGGGLFIGLRAWRSNSQLVTEKKNLAERLASAEIRLEQLGNMEKILHSYDPSEIQMLLQAATSEEKPKSNPSVDLNKVFVRVDTQLVNVENLQAKLNERKIDVTFELNNLQTTNTLSGLGEFYFVKKDGSLVKVPTNKNDLSFQIQRFKRIQTSFMLPDGVAPNDVFGLRLEIQDKDGGVIFGETYPLYHIQS